MRQVIYFPTVVYYLAQWHPQERCTKALALFSSGIVVAGIVTYPLSGWIITHLHGIYGLSGWQWVFPIEGLPCAALGLLIPLLLDESYRTANWLTAEEKALITVAIENGTPVSEGQPFGQMLRDPCLYGLMLVYFTIVAALNVLTFWLPTMIRAFGIVDTGTVGLYAAIPHVFAVLAMIVTSARTDRRRRWRQNAIISALIAAAVLCLLPSVSGSFVLSIGMLSVAAITLFSLVPVFWTIVPTCMPGPGSAAAIAVVTTVGVLGAFVSPVTIGWLKTLTGSERRMLFIWCAAHARHAEGASPRLTTV